MSGQDIFKLKLVLWKDRVPPCTVGIFDFREADFNFEEGFHSVGPRSWQTSKAINYRPLKMGPIDQGIPEACYFIAFLFIG